jgi:hypothetical protein
MEGDGFCDLITMEAFCREKADELLIQRGLKVDALSRQKIAKAFGAAVQRASLTLAKLAIGQGEALMGSPASPSHSAFGSQTANASRSNLRRWCGWPQTAARADDRLRVQVSRHSGFRSMTTRAGFHPRIWWHGKRK